VFIHMRFNELYTELLSRWLALIRLQMKSDYVIERSAEELLGDKWGKDVIPGMDTQYVIEDARPRQSSSRLTFLVSDVATFMWRAILLQTEIFHSCCILHLLLLCRKYQHRNLIFNLVINVVNLLHSAALHKPARSSCVDVKITVFCSVTPCSLVCKL